MKIAAYLNADDQVAGFYEPGRVKVFEQNGTDWNALREVPLTLSPGEALAEFHSRIRNLVEQIRDCSIFLCGEMKRAVPCAVIQKQGFELWFSEGPVLQVLDWVAQKIAEQKQETDDAPLPLPEPIPAGEDGHYTFNLHEVLQADHTVSSQDILIPFLEESGFSSLELICSHPPCWLSRNRDRLGVSMEEKPADGDEPVVRIIIRPAL